VRTIPRQKATVNPFARVTPTAIYQFIDKIIVWSQHSISETERNLIASKCLGDVVCRRNGQYFKTSKGCRSVWHPDPAYKMRPELFQPSNEALELVGAICRKPRLTYVEMAMDWVFDRLYHSDNAYDLVDKHSVKKHGRGQVRYCKTTRYSGPRRSATNLAVYPDKPSKMTGELGCLHFDWRIKGADALRRSGIASIDDLLALDHHAFWRERLRFYDLDLERFGRLSRNSKNGSKRRSPWIINRPNYRCNVDWRLGYILFDNAGRSVQNVVSKYRKQLDIRSCLIRLSVDHLLTNTMSFDISTISRVTPPTPYRHDISSQSRGDDTN
jgi:hypothetical protein